MTSQWGDRGTGPLSPALRPLAGQEGLGSAGRRGASGFPVCAQEQALSRPAAGGTAPGSSRVRPPDLRPPLPLGTGQMCGPLPDLLSQKLWGFLTNPQGDSSACSSLRTPVPGLPGRKDLSSDPRCVLSIYNVVQISSRIKASTSPSAKWSDEWGHLPGQASRVI